MLAEGASVITQDALRYLESQKIYVTDIEQQERTDWSYVIKFWCRDYKTEEKSSGIILCSCQVIAASYRGQTVIRLQTLFGGSGKSRVVESRGKSSSNLFDFEEARALVSLLRGEVWPNERRGLYEAANVTLTCDSDDDETSDLLPAIAEEVSAVLARYGRVLRSNGHLRVERA